MHISKPKVSKGTPDRPPLKAVDLAGAVWRHSNPAELYRFIRSRNDLLKTIIATRC